MIAFNIRNSYLINKRASFVGSMVALAAIAMLSTPKTLGQMVGEGQWQKGAEARIKGIYDRGDFRAKVVRPTWLPNSSGFIVDEADSNSNQSISWFYDAATGERNVASPEQIAAKTKDRANAPRNVLRFDSRDATLLAIDAKSEKPIELVSGPSGRQIEYRNPIVSPDGSKVAFVEADYTDVRQRSVLVPGDPSYPGVQQNRFARVGESIEKLRLGVVNIDGSSLAWLPIESPAEGCYLGQFAWAGNSNEILVERFSRFRDKRDIFLVHLDGLLKSMFTETSQSWVEASQGKNSGIVWIKEGKEFIVISEKDGWRHAYRYSRAGEELAKLTTGEYDIIDRAVVDEENGWYYFYASPTDGTQKYLFRVALDGSGDLQRISPNEQTGTHDYQFSPDAKWAVHSFSQLNSPPIFELIEIESHRVIKLLESNDSVREKLKKLQCSPAEFLKLDIGNGIEFDAWMLKPRGFDDTKKYPLFIYVYGEPHAQTVLDEWGAAQIDFHRVVAELGYIVVSIDNRGTPAPKGAAWRRAIFGSLGPLSTDEQEAGLKALAKACPFIDTNRVGIWGWSGGGSNTLNALFRKPDSYQVGIAVVPKPQPHLYNAWFQEIYMRDRKVNPDGYERSAPINFAQGLKGKLLIMTGSGETNTHIQIIEGLVDRLISLGKPFDYMVYPNRDHGLREGDGTVVHVRMHILRYLMNNLAAGPR